MSLAVSLRRLFEEGRLVLEGSLSPADEGSIELVLKQAFEDCASGLAGPRLEWQPALGCSAAGFFAQAAWFLFDLATPATELERLLAFPRVPRNADEHLSADLVFRYLPTILRRARALGPGDRLSAIVTGVLRRWPLSGVLAQLPDKPSTDLDFHGHPGLQLLYAERLAEHFNPGWLPAHSDQGYVELVWSELGRAPELLAVTEKTEGPS